MNIDTQLLVLFPVILKKNTILVKKALVADDLSEFILVTPVYQDSRMVVVIEK